MTEIAIWLKIQMAIEANLILIKQRYANSGNKVQYFWRYGSV